MKRGQAVAVLNSQSEANRKIQERKKRGKMIKKTKKKGGS
jgi:hypothetical protein